jgi:hypothetical protein
MQMKLSSPFLLHMGGDKGYLGEPSQELWVCSLYHAHDRKINSQNLLLGEGAPSP